jgi:hypothetical protein
MFKEPYLDINEMRDAPVHHHYVHGGFKGIDTRFSFYFPEKSQYQGASFRTSRPFPTMRTSRRKREPPRRTK